jgi:hypothetical protein
MVNEKIIIGFEVSLKTCLPLALYGKTKEDYLLGENYKHSEMSATF